MPAHPTDEGSGRRDDLADAESDGRLAAAPSAVAGGHPRTTLPAAVSVLAVVARPGDESCYLGAVLDAFRAQGAAVSVLTLTSGEPERDAAAPPGLAAPELRIARPPAADGPVVGPPGADEFAGHVRWAVRECDADLLLTVDGGVAGRAVPHSVARAGRECEIPVLGWTLPREVASAVRRASGLAVTGKPHRLIDVEIRVRRSAQRRAMRAYRGQARDDRAQLTRLAIQGDREWLCWLVPVRSAIAS